MLSPIKLAAFYKAVGGNYDCKRSYQPDRYPPPKTPNSYLSRVSYPKLLPPRKANHHLISLHIALFVDMPPQSISYIWQATGCQHTLQPREGDDFAPPSIPALTAKGFVRWESIEILLGPVEHVPFMQFAVKHWDLRNPDDGTPFPPDLPATVFPSQPDRQIDEWHKQCAVKLRSKSAARDEYGSSAGDSGSKDEKSFPGVAHVRVSPAAAAAAAASSRAYFERPLGVRHVRPAGYTGSHGAYHDRERDRERDRGRDRDRDRDRRPDRDPEARNRYPQRPDSSSDEKTARRRRSFSDYPSPPAEIPTVTQSMHGIPGVTHLNAPRPPPVRRHSQPRHVSSPSDSDEPVSPRSKRRSHHIPNDPPPASVRRVFGPEHTSGGRGSSAMPQPAMASVAPTSLGEAGRRPSRDNDSRRRSFVNQIDNIKEKISNIYSGGNERPRSGSRGEKDDLYKRRADSKYSKENLPGSHLSRSWSNEADSEDTNPEEREKLRRRRLERDREQDRERNRDRDRDRERIKPRSSERLRDREPDDRKDRDRDRDRDRERDRDRGRDSHRTRVPRDKGSDDDDVSPRTRPRDRDRDRDRGDRSPYLSRPDGYRRPSSHTDTDRRREPDARESRDRDRLKDRDWDDRRRRDRDRDRDRGKDKDRDRDRDWERDERGPRDERERSSREERVPTPPIKGVSGRVYPDSAWT